MSRVVTFGEVMLRLKSPGFERLFQSPMLEAAFGGAGAAISRTTGTACSPSACSPSSRIWNGS